jgi:hypothetical protein
MRAAGRARAARKAVSSISNLMYDKRIMEIQANSVKSQASARRLFSLIFLTFLTTPVPPTLQVSLKLLKNKQTQRLASALLIGLFGCILEGVVAFWLPISWLAAMLLVLLLAVLVGYFLYCLEPTDSPAAEPQGERAGILREILLWGLLTAVVYTLTAFVAAVLFTKWSLVSTLKPSFPSSVLRIIACFFFPLGILIGIGMAAFKKRISLLISCTFIGTVPALMLASMSSLLFFESLTESALGFRLDPSECFIPNIIWIDTAHVVAFVALYLWLAGYLLFAKSLSEFLLKTLMALLVFSGFFFQAYTLDTQIPLAFHYKMGLKELSKKNWDATQFHCKVMTHRNPWNSYGTAALENWGVAAVYSRNTREWNEVLQQSAAIDTLSFRTLSFPAADALSRETKTLKPALLDINPIKPESYLSDSWCAFLTAARKSFGNESETKVKYRLKNLSSTQGNLNLPPLEDLQDLMMAAKFFDLTPVLLPTDFAAAAIREGYPVLFHDPVDIVWGVIIGIDEPSGALLWFDYSHYDRNRIRSLEKEEIRALVSAEDTPDKAYGEVFAETIRVDFFPSLERRLRSDGGWIALVASQGTPIPDAWPKLDPSPLVTRDMARRALDENHMDRFRRIIEEHKDAPWASGLGRARALLAPESGEAPSSFTRDEGLKLFEENRLNALDIWTLRFLEKEIPSRIDVGKEVSFRFLKRLAELAPDSAYANRALMKTAADLGRQEEAVAAGRRYAFLFGFDQSSSMETLETVAGFANPTPQAKELMRFLLTHTRLLSWSGTEKAPKLRRFLAPCCAARAQLSSGTRDKLAWWKRAAELDSQNPRFLKNYAATLRQAGREKEAERIEQTAAAFETTAEAP